MAVMVQKVIAQHVTRHWLAVSNIRIIIRKNKQCTAKTDKTRNACRKTVRCVMQMYFATSMLWFFV